MELKKDVIDNIICEFNCDLDQALKIYQIQTNESLNKAVYSQILHFDEHVEHLASAIRDISESNRQIAYDISQLENFVKGDSID